jgi:hypothetical protein
MSRKNSNDTIGNRTRDVLVCSAVSQPTAPPRAPLILIIVFKNPDVLKERIAFVFSRSAVHHSSLNSKRTFKDEGKTFLRNVENTNPATEYHIPEDLNPRLHAAQSTTPSTLGLHISCELLRYLDELSRRAKNCGPRRHLVRSLVAC